MKKCIIAILLSISSSSFAAGSTKENLWLKFLHPTELLLKATCAGDHASVARALSSVKVDINGRNGNKNTPLHIASCTCYPGSGYPRNRVFRLLLEAKADVNAQNRRKRTPLHFVASEYEVQAKLNALIRAKANLDAKDEDGLTLNFLKFSRVLTTLFLRQKV